MSLQTELRQLWLSIQEIAMPMAELRDKYVEFPGMHPRFSHLYDAWQNLLAVEQAIFEFMELKKPTFGKKPDREFIMISKAAISNSKILLKIATDEYAVLSSKD